MVARIRLDHGGIEEILKSGEVASLIHSTAEAVASTVREHPSVQRAEAPVDVTDYVTDRAASAVTIAHPAGLPIEAKYGPLAAAAGAQGLEVTTRV